VRKPRRELCTLRPVADHDLTYRNTGRGTARPTASNAVLGIGRKRSRSTPRDHSFRCEKPCRASSDFSDRVDTIVAAAGA
jgi:hypothetical protein